MSNLIDPNKYGVSFSLKQCAAFNLNQEQTLRWLIDDAGFRRFRLMSYWNEHEKEQGKYDFTALDTQVELIRQSGGVITLSLGARQPRWPENHWPEWAWHATTGERSAALLAYISKVVERYKDNPAIISYQLENEALLKSFGRNPEVDRPRLNEEYKLIKKLDPNKPIIMSTSNGWGIPFRHPIPDVIGFSFYPIMFKHGKYTRTVQRPWLHKLRRKLIQVLWQKPVFIHELQCEPWGHTAIWKMSIEEQSRSMSVQQILHNIQLAKQVDSYPIDLWGAEWWYWRLTKFRDQSVWNAVTDALEETQKQSELPEENSLGQGKNTVQ